MHRVKNLFEQVCSMRNLRLAAKEALRGEWSLVCLTHNLLKLFGVRIAAAG